jgi:hypothetical protein
MTRARRPIGSELLISHNSQSTCKPDHIISVLWKYRLMEKLLQRKGTAGTWRDCSVLTPHRFRFRFACNGRTSYDLGPETCIVVFSVRFTILVCHLQFSSLDSCSQHLLYEQPPSRVTGSAYLVNKAKSSFSFFSICTFTYFQLWKVYHSCYRDGL